LGGLETGYLVDGDVISLDGVWRALGPTAYESAAGIHTVLRLEKLAIDVRDIQDAARARPENNR
jgi:hypothetical protein